MEDPGIIVISVHEHEPDAWAGLVRNSPLAEVLEVRLGGESPGAESLESLSRIAEENGLSLRLRS